MKGCNRQDTPKFIKPQIASGAANPFTDHSPSHRNTRLRLRSGVSRNVMTQPMATAMPLRTINPAKVASGTLISLAANPSWLGPHTVLLVASPSAWREPSEKETKTLWCSRSRIKLTTTRRFGGPNQVLWRPGACRPGIAIIGDAGSVYECLLYPFVQCPARLTANRRGAEQDFCDAVEPLLPGL